MANLKLSPPWIILHHEFKAFFAEDPEVHVGYDDEEKKIVVYVDNSKKAEALEELLREKVFYGNTEVTIDVVPANITCGGNATMEDAFAGNGNFDHIEKVTAFGFDMTFVVFKAKVVQYRTDDISDFYGLQSTLYEDIARDICKPSPKIFYCTEPTVGVPLGEWP